MWWICREFDSAAPSALGPSGPRVLAGHGRLGGLRDPGLRHGAELGKDLREMQGMRKME